MSNSEILLSQQDHIGDSAIQAVTSNAVKGDGYYGRSDGFHTVQYTLTGFIGTIEIEATLSVQPTEDDWFTVISELYDIDQFGETTTGSFIANFTGNYVWIRAKVVDWTDGTVNSILINH